MSDIVEWLRSYNKVASYDAVALVDVKRLNEAADEIERLTKENDRLKAKLRELGHDEH